VRRFSGRALILLVAVAATAAGVLLIDGEGDGGDGGSGDRITPAPPAAPPRSPHRAPGHVDSPRAHESTRREVRQAVHESRSPKLDPSQRQVAATVRAYVAALNTHDGARGCALFVRGALAGFDFPVEQRGCAASLSASVGYHDPRGFPVYETSRVPRIPRVVIEGQKARVTATTVTRFADRREPSVEDDVIYLSRANGRWLIAKPSATLYRAIGAGNIPPTVLAPP
jgi:hypothetical protein